MRAGDRHDVAADPDRSLRHPVRRRSTANSTVEVRSVSGSRRSNPGFSLAQRAAQLVEYKVRLVLESKSIRTDQWRFDRPSHIAKIARDAVRRALRLVATSNRENLLGQFGEFKIISIAPSDNAARDFAS